ncbi:disease resistance protein RUN1-like [Diospyros lotus]|uniref:disease resistance protein RUN1-like n=1 Tax=Diospyros lotus TaxID=55363 RepID=UPI00224D4290|nr:disease resistance protein RUN1-like [Diospyros lotus]
MSNQQLLHISDVQLCGNYKNFPNGLRWLCWPHFPLQMIPSNFPLDRVVALEMPHTCLKKMLNGTKCLVLLKILDLSHSYNLLEAPDFSLLPNLVRHILEHCTRLVKVNESIGDLERFVILNLRNCQNLKKLPKTVSKLKSLAILDISGCLNLENFPSELENMDSLKVLCADGTALNQFFSTTLEVEAWHLSIWPWPLNLRRSPEISCVSFSVFGTLKSCKLQFV